MKRLPLSVLTLVAVILTANAQTHSHGDRTIAFPNVPGFQTLAVDLHLHTVFSDGSVWPDIRVEEAIRDGLDAIALTDHLEYQPHRHDIPHPDRNRSHAVAVASGEGTDLIIINGSEITRQMPPGHSNAIFLEDANALLVEDSMEAFRAARAQDAFIFWNHPMWEVQAETGIAELSDMHRQLIEEGLLDGIEVVNDVTYSQEALQIALDHDLTIIGTSDIHGLVDWQFEVPEGGHRPVTLVFARERTEEGLKEALVEGRTAVWFEDVLIGREEHLHPLLQSSIQVAGAAYEEDTSILRVELANRSDAGLILRNRSDFTFHEHADVFTLKPNHTETLRVKTIQPKEVAELRFEVLNAVVRPDVHPILTIEARPQ